MRYSDKIERLKELEEQQVELLSQISDIVSSLEEEHELKIKNMGQGAENKPTPHKIKKSPTPPAVKTYGGVSNRV